MVYIRRHAEENVRQLVDTFKVILITGPRQVGKSTMLKEMYSEDVLVYPFKDI